MENEDKNNNEELNIADMKSEEIVKAVEDGKLTIDEVKDFSEELEKNTKSTLDDKSKQILEDRIKKIEKLKGTKAEDTATEEVVKQDMSIDDIITLREKGFAKDSEEAKVLKQFKDAGIIEDYQSGIDQIAVKASLEAINAKRTAASQVNESDDDMLKASIKETESEYKTSGEVPESAEDQRKLAERNIDRML